MRADGLPDGTAKLERVKYGQRETTTTLAEDCGVSSMANEDGTVTLELYRYGKNGTPLDTFRIVLPPDEAPKHRNTFQKWRTQR